MEHRHPEKIEWKEAKFITDKENVKVSVLPSGEEPAEVTSEEGKSVWVTRIKLALVFASNGVTVDQLKVKLVLPNSAIDSNPSKPYTVLSNGNQKATATKRHLYSVLFYQRNEVPLDGFQKEAIRLWKTQRKGKNQKRPLSEEDLQFFCSDTHFTKQHFAVFGNYFPSVLFRISCSIAPTRHKCISDLYQAYLILGFVTREQVEKLMSSYPPGSFCLYFYLRGFYNTTSIGEIEPEDGTLLISYKAKNGEIERYLAQEEYPAPLPNELKKKKFLKQMVRVQPPAAGGATTHCLVDKETALGPYYKKSPEYSIKPLPERDNSEPTNTLEVERDGVVREHKKRKRV